MTSTRAAADPDRRDRIIGAALDVIINHGVHRTTHRKIAQAAGVPLGSVTYYFDSLESLINSAFDRLVAVMSARYAAALDAATDTDTACDAVTDLICGEAAGSREELVAIFEMYSFANHDSTARTLMATWVEISRVSLAKHFSADACSGIDALVEGWSIHRSLATSELDSAVVRRAIGAIAAASPHE
ncbi:MAG: TetR/AcrR family transcriptional regulator [Mycetocola sp.]